MEPSELKEKVEDINTKMAKVQGTLKKMKSDGFVKEANGNGKKPTPEEGTDGPKEEQAADASEADTESS